MNNNKRADTISTVLPGSLSENTGLLRWERKHLSKETFFPVSIAKYLESGHEPIDSAIGDINDDNIEDLLLVTSIINEDSLRTNSVINGSPIHFDSLPLKRQLLILTGLVNGTYRLESRNINVIPCLDCCGMTDPFGGIAIKEGQIIITEYCASNCKGISEYRFTYSSSQNNWYLDKIILESYCFDFHDHSLDTITTKDFGKVSISKFNINKQGE